MSANPLDAILEKKSGVYVLDATIKAADVEQNAKQQGLTFFHIDGTTIDTKRTFLRALSAALHFPTPFGQNWDALLDVLRDLSWLPGSGHVLLITGLRGFTEHDRDEYATALDVLRDAAHFAAQTASARPLIILVSL